MGSWFSANRISIVDPVTQQWELHSREGTSVHVFLDTHKLYYYLTVKQGNTFYKIQQSKKLCEIKTTVDNTQHRLNEIISLVHLESVAELESLLSHSNSHPHSDLVATVCHLNMFGKFTDGLSGIKGMVNSASLGKNQTPLHLAVKSNTEFTVDQLLKAGADPLARDETGNTPLHTAAFVGSGVALQTILAHPSCKRVKEELLEMTNSDGDTPLHLACKAPQVNCIEILLDQGSQLSKANNENLRPIQSAVMSPFADVNAIDMLLEHDYNQVHVLDGAGNGLLHHAKGAKVVQCLVHHGVDTNLRNNKGQTALHKVVLDDDSENPLDQVMALVLHGVNVDVEDSNGDTVLHCLARLTAKQGSNREYLIKGLVVLGADLNRRNRSGRNVYELAKTESCRSTMTLLSAIGADDAKYLNVKVYPDIDSKLLEAASSSKVPRIRKNWSNNHAAVLALDGGGIRGLVLVQLLLDLERRTGLKTTQLFDWIGGTSTGSMLTLGMIYADMNLRDVQKLYFGLKDEIFKGGRPYNTEVLENFMKDKFSENGVMSSRQFPRVVVPGTIADCRPFKLHIFKNYGFRSENDLPPPHLQKIWEVSRSSSAAPTYFTPHKRFIDGGLMANNPTIAMLTEMHECNQDAGKLGYSEAAAPVSFTEGLMRAVIGSGFDKREQDTSAGYIESRPVEENGELVKDVFQEPTKPYIVISLGTGLAPEVMVKDYNVSSMEGPLGAGRFLLGVKEFAGNLVEQCAATDGSVVMGAKAWCESIGSFYFRLQPQLTYDMKMDEVDNKNLVECLWDVQCFIYQKKHQFEKMSDMLVSAFCESS